MNKLLLIKNFKMKMKGKKRKEKEEKNRKDKGKRMRIFKGTGAWLILVIYSRLDTYI